VGRARLAPLERSRQAIPASPPRCGKGERSRMRNARSGKAAVPPYLPPYDGNSLPRGRRIS
jgi:hypothetical protein